jgi:hypothetical protein
MVEKESDETRVIYWYHRRFIEVANAVYVSKLSPEERENVFSNVIDFFNETWKDKPKPFKYNQRIKKKKNLVTDESEASRNTTTQPTEFITEDGVVRYNKRKLTELPGFISKLTPSLCIPLACKHIYFNYEFSHGQFTCCSYDTIFKEIQDLRQLSSYALNEETSKANQELKFLNFLYLQCLISMNDHPDSMAIQILSRNLIFHGYLTNFTELINQCDKLSPKHCALIASYQSLQPPGIGPLFTLEKHSKPIYSAVFCHKNSSFVFTLSDKINVFNLMEVKVVGDLLLPTLTLDEHYKQMLIYFTVFNDDNNTNLKLMNGAAVVISDHLIYSINFDSTVNFMKTFDNVTINKIYKISSNHILVFFENSKYFEIYNFHTGEILLSKTFALEIKFIETNLSNGQNFDTPVKLLIVLKNSEIQILDITGVLETENRKLNNLNVDLISTLPSPGIDCVACAKAEKSVNYSSSVKFSSFFLSFKDGSLLIFGSDSLENKTLTGICLKPILEEYNQNGIQLSLKLLHSIENRILLIDENQFIYFMEENENNLYYLSKIGGYYTNGYFLAKNIVCGINNGLVDIFQLSNGGKDGKEFKSIFLMQIDAHFMDITHLYYKGDLKNDNNLLMFILFLFCLDSLMFTTSKDSTFKAFHLQSMLMNSVYNFKLDRSLNETKNIFIINHSCFGTWSDDSP